LCGNERALDLSIEDNGCGFAMEPQPGHGLLFMRMRIESIGGRFESWSGTGIGTRLHAVVPLEASA
jgi:signal transduction histidine kinase